MCDMLLVNKFWSYGTEVLDQQHVAHEHVEEDHADVESLAESKVNAVGFISLLEVLEVLSNDARFCSFFYDFVHEFTFQAAFPEDARNLREPDGECEEERKPEVVGSHPAVPFFILDTRLVNIATSSLTLQVLLHIPSPVDPAVRFCIVISIPAVDGSTIQAVLEEDEREAEYENGSCVLVVNPEQQVVNLVFVPSKPLEEVLKDGQLPHCHGRHFAIWRSSVKNLLKIKSHYNVIFYRSLTITFYLLKCYTQAV